MKRSEFDFDIDKVQAYSEEILRDREDWSC